jgi:serine phosphatase RsbU (regulator of sigma subunit)
MPILAEHPDQRQELKALISQSIKNKDYKKAATHCLQLGKLYQEEQQSDQAIDYFNQCITYGKRSNDNLLQYQASHSLAEVFRANRSFVKAVDHFEKASKFAKALNNYEWVAEELISLSETYAETGKHKKTIEPLEEALSFAIQLNNLQLQQKCYEQLADYHDKLGNTLKSKEYQTLLNNLIQSRKKEELSEKQLKELETEIEHVTVEKKVVRNQLTMETEKLKKTEDSLLTTKSSLDETTSFLLFEKEANEKRKLEINLLNKDKELAEMKLQEQNSKLEKETLIRNTTILIACITIVFFIIFGIVMLLNYRRKLTANKKIEEQNKSIKSSINYAKRIQEAMLPKPDLQSTLLPDSFVLFKPRDSVSGDFYWFSEIKNWYNPDVVFAAADCTGHGVPGAFMSMIGISALNGIINKGIAETNDILEALDVEIKTALHQQKTGNNDGMDIALCIYRKEKNTIEFSGAKNPLVYIQNNELRQVKGDPKCIGGSKSPKDVKFSKHNILIDQPTMLYLFSDGYKDQFGGPNNSKFMSKQFNNLLLEIHQKSLKEQMEILDKTIELWKAQTSQTDDILVMGIRLDHVQE